MLLSRSSEYAVQALLYIAKSPDRMILAKGQPNRKENYWNDPLQYFQSNKQIRFVTSVVTFF